jgi:transcriptional regulator with XRE-family HTH domain
MKTTRDYLDAIKVKLDIPSDYATAKALGVTRAAVSRWRLCKATPDDLTCAKIAEILGIEPIEVIAAINFERSTDEHARAVWESIWGKAAAATARDLRPSGDGRSVAASFRGKVFGSTVIFFDQGRSMRAA